MNSQGSIQDIMQIYTTSTIGDGLVSQIPALLISVATGMVVTRSASENSLSEDLTKQFLAQPRVLMTAGGAAACLCLIPGFPVLQILMISARHDWGGYLSCTGTRRAWWRRLRKDTGGDRGYQREASFIRILKMYTVF